MTVSIINSMNPNPVSSSQSTELTTAQIANVRDNLQGYFGVITDGFNPAVTNTSQELVANTWTDIEMSEYILSDASLDVQKTIGIYDSATHEFSCAGLDTGSYAYVRILVKLNPEVDESTSSVRLNFTTNSATQATGLVNFQIESKLIEMSQGANLDYSDEEIISFFVGDTLVGDTVEDAGKFNIQINSSVEANLEVLGVTLYMQA